MSTGVYRRRADPRRRRTPVALLFAAGPQLIPVGLATETDTALGTTPSKLKALGLASETDTALSITPSKAAAVGLATETDTALAITVSGQLLVGTATETDTALSITPSKIRALGIATETNTALALATTVKVRAVGLASETDTALAVTASGGAVAAFAHEGLLLQLEQDLDAFFGDPSTDIAAFFDTDDMGFSQTLTHSGTDYQCIYDSPSTDGGEKEGPQVWVTDVTAALIDRADTVTVELIDYIVAGKQPDGTGVTLLVLYENLT